MAAQVASQSSNGSQIRDGVPGVSYANAVLNLKNTMDNNKENINDSVVGPKNNEPLSREASVKSNTPSSLQQKLGKHVNTYATAGKPISNVEEFPQISSVNTKNLRRNGTSHKGDREQVVSKTKPKISNCDSLASVPVSSNNTNKISPACESIESESGSDTVEEGAEKKKFVEAPLPKINPWTKNKNTIVATENTSDQLTSSATEKRVLQPQQQGTVGKCIFLYIPELIPIIRPTQ